MQYIELEDYSLSISHKELTDILEEASDGYSISEDEVRLKCESRAESKINNFLSAKYDLAVEFVKTGTARNMALVGVYIDLTLCALFKSVSPTDIPEMRDENCKDAILNLEMWRDGSQDLTGVPIVPDPVKGHVFISPTKFISKPEADPLIIDPIPIVP